MLFAFLSIQMWPKRIFECHTCQIYYTYTKIHIPYKFKMVYSHSIPYYCIFSLKWRAEKNKQTNIHTYTAYIDLLLWPMLPYQSMHNLNHEFNVFFVCFKQCSYWEGFEKALSVEKRVRARRRRWHLMIYSFLLKILDLWQSRNVYFDWIYYWEIPLR